MRDIQGVSEKKCILNMIVHAVWNKKVYRDTYHKLFFLTLTLWTFAHYCSCISLWQKQTVNVYDWYCKNYYNPYKSVFEFDGSHLYDWRAEDSWNTFLTDWWQCTMNDDVNYWCIIVVIFKYTLFSKTLFSKTLIVTLIIKLTNKTTGSSRYFQFILT